MNRSEIASALDLSFEKLKKVANLVENKDKQIIVDAMKHLSNGIETEGFVVPEEFKHPGLKKTNPVGLGIADRLLKDVHDTLTEVVKFKESVFDHIEQAIEHIESVVKKDTESIVDTIEEPFKEATIAEDAEAVNAKGESLDTPPTEESTTEETHVI